MRYMYMVDCEPAFVKLGIKTFLLFPLTSFAFFVWNYEMRVILKCY